MSLFFNHSQSFMLICCDWEIGKISPHHYNKSLLTINKCILGYTISPPRCNLIIYSVVLMALAILLYAASGIFGFSITDTGLEFYALGFLSLVAGLYIWIELYIYFKKHNIKTLTALTLSYIIIKGLSVLQEYLSFFIVIEFGILYYLEIVAKIAFGIFLFLHSPKIYVGLKPLRGYIICVFCLFLLLQWIDEYYSVLEDYINLNYLNMLEIIPLYFLFEFGITIKREYGTVNYERAMS